MKTLAVFLSALLGIVLWVLVVRGSVLATAPVTFDEDVAWTNAYNCEATYTVEDGAALTLKYSDPTSSAATALSVNTITGVEYFEWMMPKSGIAGFGNNYSESPEPIVSDMDFAFYADGISEWRAYEFGVHVATGNYLPETDVFTIGVVPNGDVLYGVNTTIAYRSVNPVKTFPYYLRWKHAASAPIAPTPTPEPTATPTPEPTPTPAPSPTASPTPFPTPCKRLPNGKCKK